MFLAPSQLKAWPGRGGVGRGLAKGGCADEALDPHLPSTLHPATHTGEPPRPGV